MKILIVEDDDMKLEALSDYIRARLPDVEIKSGQSLHSGLTLALHEAADAIFLDMTMTNFDRGKDEDGGRPHAFAGREILRRMARKKIKTPVFVFTQFSRFDDDRNSMSLDELTQELTDRFDNFVGTVQYQVNVEVWKQQVDEHLEKLTGGEI